jgi:hypothetical protein
MVMLHLKIVVADRNFANADGLMLFVVAGWCWGEPRAVANAKRGGASHSSTVSQEEFHMDIIYLKNNVFCLLEENIAFRFA